MVVGRSRFLGPLLTEMCEFLELRIRQVADCHMLRAALREEEPLAVVTETDADADPGCQVMKVVARYDRELPVLLVAGNDPTTLGSLDAIEELWQLTSVRKLEAAVDPDEVMDFLFHAGRRQGNGRLMRV